MRWLRALYVANGLAYGVFISFLSIFLRTRGFEDALVGFAASLSSLGFTLALPAWGHFSDVLVGPRRAVQIAALPAAVVAAAFDAPLPALGLVALSVGLGMFAGPVSALTDAIGVPALRDRDRDYGRLRLLSSAGAGMAAIVGGVLYDATGGYWLAPLLYAGCQVFAIVIVQMMPIGRESDRSRARRDGRTPERRTGRFGSVSEVMSGRPRFALTLLSVLLIYIAVMVGGTYLSLRIADLGGGATAIGVATGISAFAEVPGLLFGGLVAVRVGLRRLLLASALALALVTASWGILTDPTVIVVTRLVAGFSFGAMTYALVLGIAAQLPNRLQSTGQTLFQATGFGAAAVIANFTGGIVKEGLGSFVLFGAAGVLAAVGAVIGLVALRTTVPVHEDAVPAPQTSEPAARRRASLP